MNNKNKGCRETIYTIIGWVLVGGQLAFYLFICILMLWEAWFRTPAERDQADRLWEMRDNLPEDVKKELRAKYDLLTHDNIPDNEPTGPWAGDNEPTPR